MSIPERVAAELLRRDLMDIGVLRNSDSFIRYFMRRLKQKEDETRDHFENDLPSVCSKDQREEYRIKLQAYKELRTLLDTDESGALSTLASNPSVSEQPTDVRGVNISGLGIGERPVEQPRAADVAAAGKRIGTAGYT